METTYPLLSTISQQQPSSRQRTTVIALAVLAFLLSGMPKLNVSLGAPLYAVDLVILYLLIKSYWVKTPKEKRLRRIRYKGYPQAIVVLLSSYLFFVMIGEIHGGFVYDMPLESIYILIRSCLAISIAYIIPKQVRTLFELRTILQGVCLGLLLSATLAMLYSVPTTRGMTDTLFSLKALAPNSDAIVGSGNIYYDQEFSGNYRGLTLIGASTFSSGVMATLWPMLFVGLSASYRRGLKGAWKLLHWLAIGVVPLGVLATYGRSAWLSILLVLVSMLLWGSSRGRLKLLVSVVLTGLLIGQIGVGEVTSKLPLVDRVINKTQLTVESGAATESEAERFLAYVEPFSHLTRHPSFLLMGSGAAQRRWAGNVYEEADTASHAIPGMAYYAYGVGGALCQIGLMILTFGTIYRRLRQAQRHLPGAVWIWRSLLACWFGLLPWWCFGHGIVTAPRGAMVFFFFIGVLLAYDQIFTRLCAQAASTKTALSSVQPTSGPAL